MGLSSCFDCYYQECWTYSKWWERVRKGEEQFKSIPWRKKKKKEGAKRDSFHSMLRTRVWKPDNWIFCWVAKELWGEWQEEAPVDCSQYIDIYMFWLIACCLFHCQPHVSWCTTLTLHSGGWGLSEGKVYDVLVAANMGEIGSSQPDATKQGARIWIMSVIYLFAPLLF